MDVSGIELFTRSAPKEPKVVGYVRSWQIVLQKSVE